MTRCIHVKIIKNVVPMLIAPEVPNRNHYLLSSGKLAKKCNLRARVRGESAFGRVGVFLHCRIADWS